MTKALVITAPSNADVMAGNYVTATFEGPEARNEAVGYISAMYERGYWPRSNVFCLVIDGQIDDYAFNADEKEN
jgi:hypothetical protein